MGTIVDENVRQLDIVVGKLIDLCGQVVEKKGVSCEQIRVQYNAAAERGDELLYAAECLLGRASRDERKAALAVLHPARALWRTVCALTSKRIHAWASGNGLIFEGRHEQEVAQETMKRIQEAIASERDPFIRKGLQEDLVQVYKSMKG